MSEIAPATTGYIYTNNLCSPFFDKARRRPDRIAIVYGDQTYRYADLVMQIDATIDLFLDSGVKRGDRVAILCHNHPAMLVILFALARLGVVYLPLNPRSSLEEVRSIANDAEITSLVISPDLLQAMSRLQDELPYLTFISIEEAHSDWPILSVKDLTGAKGISRHPLCETDQDSLAVILYTSGTTGDPKGVMITHGNIWAIVTNVHLTTHIVDSAVVLSIAPMFHVGSLSYALAALAAGGKVVIMPSFDPDGVYKALAMWKVTFTFCVPTMLFILENHPKFANHDFSDLMIMAAGAPVPIATLRKWLDRGVRITQGYGMTEGGSTVLDPARALEKAGSAGMPSPLTEVQIRDLETNLPILQAGVNGQIFMRGPAISKGYWNRPEETAVTFDSDGWLASGDVGYWDEEGFIYIVDRIKDMIISGGMNVYPAEVEKVLCGHERVDSTAVIGLPDEKWGERVTAVLVVRGSEPIEEEELRAYCRAKMSSYKVPQQFEFVDNIPLGPSGKILKRELREQFITCFNGPLKSEAS